MIDLSVMPVHSFTKWHKWQPRIPVYADWNAIPIEEIIHNWRQTFFHFFLILSVPSWKGQKSAPACQNGLAEAQKPSLGVCGNPARSGKKGTWPRRGWRGSRESLGRAGQDRAGQGRAGIAEAWAHFHAFVAQGRLIVGRWGRESSHDTARRASGVSVRRRAA